MHWAVINVKTDKITCFGSFGIEHAWKEIKRFIGNKNMILNIYRMQTQTHDSRWFTHNSHNFMFNNKSLVDFTSPF